MGVGAADFRCGAFLEVHLRSGFTRDDFLNDGGFSTRSTKPTQDPRVRSIPTPSGFIFLKTYLAADL